MSLLKHSFVGGFFSHQVIDATESTGPRAQSGPPTHVQWKHHIRRLGIS